ncbi:unnamed protein product [Rotaria sp. Silwood2]|nr:unnamed protein product [Rotaria sp. Silwood2]CAF2938650.1 unnamed protein product [Rotaria sp. Silwood2]CAF4007118.1 unnamed protein product [Rotaria sp. Silwood2]CAF4150791.1 unnamed protein product [Rotaria sp. Silwood2]CAF4348512.1 unnamed protein product [Rotaria sp. Silwood2]
MLDKSSFSWTDNWGNEPFACLLITCTRTMILGLCALLGIAFRQDAVGVFTCYTDDNDEMHNVFRVSHSDLSPMSIDESNKMIDEEFLCPLERLTVMTIDYYPRYQPKPLAKIYSFVIKKILGLQTKPNVYKPFLTEIVTQVLIRCCSHQFKIFYLRIIRKFSTR